jgi:serine/threonine protein kinase
MLSGDPPYYHDDIPTMYKNIKEGNLNFPKNVSPRAKDIILKLLDRNP